MRTTSPGLLLAALLLFGPRPAAAEQDEVSPRSIEDDSPEATEDLNEQSVGGSAHEISVGGGEGTEPAPSPPEGLPFPADLPAVLDAPLPIYPPAALEAGIGGRTVLELQLDADGVVTRASLLEDPGHGMGAAALAVASEAIFDSPPEEGPEHALRRYFYPVDFVPPKPESTNDPAEEQDSTAPEMADELTVLPELTRAQQPEFPVVAREAGIQGEVHLELDLDETGALRSVRMLQAAPSGWGLELEAVRAAWKMRFSPAFAGEVAVPVRITYTYGFTLEEQVVETVADSPKQGEAIDPDGPVNFSGFVRERGSRKALSGVEVLIAQLEHSTPTNERGFFEFRGIPAGLHRAIVAVPGYHAFETQEEIQPGEATEVIYFLKERPEGIPETIVRTQREKKEVAKRSITIETIDQFKSP